MSKVFDALTKSNNEASSLLFPLLSSAGSTSDAASQETYDIPGVAPPAPVHHEEDQVVRVGSVDIVTVHVDPASCAADRFRLLAVRLNERRTTGKLKSILVTSPLPGDGKTTTAVNLATVLLADTTRRVLLVDADLYRQSLARRLGIDPQPGFAECLAHGVDPVSLVRRAEPLGWYLLSSGMPVEQSRSGLFTPATISRVLQRVSAQFDWVIIDCPPVLSVSDAVALRQHTDATLMVARSGVTPVKAVDEAIVLMGREHIAGLVLNAIDSADDGYYSDGYAEGKKAEAATRA